MRGRVTASERGVITLQGQEVVYLLFRVRSRKRLTVLVDAKGELQVRTPWQVTLFQAERFMHDHASWIVQRLKSVQRVMAERPILQEGSLLPFLNGFLLLCYGGVQIRPVFREGDRLWVSGLGRSPKALAKILECWYRQQACQYLSTRLEAWSVKVGVPFNRLTVRDQKSRWGSCSSKKNISLNWRLMFLPTQVVDYVVVHELCHLCHMNHSPHFWAMVARFVPEYVACRQRLRLFSSPW